MLFLGAPGTGKTMLSKGIATSFNCPFVSIPGSGFAQTFIGMDAVLVRYLARKAKKLAAKWGGQCIVFIDEIDAVGMRRQSLGSGFSASRDPRRLFYGAARRADARRRPRARDRGVARAAVPRARRAARARLPRPARAAGRRDQALHDPGAWAASGGGLALNQLLVVMDGIDDPPATQALPDPPLEHVPRRALRRPAAHRPLPPAAASPPRPRKEEIYFIGACNVALERLDPALTRPGRMGRHIYFRTPSWEDRRDIFDLYLGKVAHEEELDEPTPPRRARAHHQRLLAGDDRPGLLARADLRALRRARGVRRATTSSRR